MRRTYVVCDKCGRDDKDLRVVDPHPAKEYGTEVYFTLLLPRTIFQGLDEKHKQMNDRGVQEVDLCPNCLAALEGWFYSK